MNQSIAKKSTNPQTEEKIWSKDFTLIVFSNFFIFLGFQMTLPTLPLFVEKLGGNDQLIGVVVGIFTFSALVVRPFAGKALENKGRHFVYAIGLAIFVLSVGSYGLLSGLALLFFMRMIQGIGWGFSTTASGTIATDLIPANKRGEGMGYYGLSGNIALALGPTLGLTLVGEISFTQLFFICAGLGVVALICSSFIQYKEVEPIQNTQKGFDLFEKSAIPPSILLFFITFTFGGIASFLPIYTAKENIPGIQWYFLLYAVALLISRTFAGKMYDKRGHIAVFIPGTILIITAMFLLVWLPNNTILFIAGILYGFGFGTVQPALQAWSVKDVAPHRRGMANATFFSFFDLGVGLGAIIFGQIAYYWGYPYIYLCSALSVLTSIIIYLYILLKERKLV